MHARMGMDEALHGPSTYPSFCPMHLPIALGMCLHPSYPPPPTSPSRPKAKALFNKDKEYVVKGDEVMIVDEFSGRILDGRRCADGHEGPRSLQPCAPSLQPYASQVGRRPAPGHGGQGEGPHPARDGGKSSEE